MTEVLARPRWRQRLTRVALVATAASAVLAVTATSASAADPTDDGFNPGPVRLVDTRINMPDRPAGKVTGFLQTQLPDTVRDNETALLSITVVNPTTSGFVKAYADSNPYPATSDVNFIAGPTVAQAVLVEAAPDSTGRIDLFVGGNSAPIDLVVDVIGSLGKNSYTSLQTAQRQFDSRAPGTGTTSGKKGTGVYQVLLPDPAGTNGVPDDAQAVAVTVTQVNAEGSGFVTVASDSTITGTSSLNYNVGSINSNLVYVKPVNGRISLQVQGAPTDLIVDVKGYSLSTAVPAVTAQRIFDSRKQSTSLLTGVVNIPLPTNAPEGADYALLNLTSTESTVGGWVASYKAAAGELQTSSLNFQPGQNVAGFVIAPIVKGQAQVYIGVGVTKLVADVEGYVVNGQAQEN